MKLKFFSKLAIFVLPFLVISCGFSVYGVYIGEMIPFPLAVELQSRNQGILYFPRYWEREDIICYRLNAYQHYQPQIVSIGSSRSEFVSQDMFRDDTIIYNSYLQGLRIEEMEQIYLSLVDIYTPKIIILHIDITNFNLAYQNRNASLNYENNNCLTQESHRIWDNFRQIMRLFLFDRSSLIIEYDVASAYKSTRPYGLTALEDNHGYRFDGSLWSARLNEQAEINLENHLLGFENRTGIISTPGDEVELSRFEIINRILDHASQQNITVIGLLPPFYPTIYDGMRSSGEFVYQNKTIERLTDIFEFYNMLLFNYSDPRIIGGTAEEMLDGWHPGQVLTARMILNITSQHPEILAEHVESNELANRIRISEGNLYLLDEN